MNDPVSLNSRCKGAAVVFLSFLPLKTLQQQRKEDSELYFLIYELCIWTRWILDRWLAKCMIAIISCLLFRHQANLDVMTLTSDESPIEVGSNRKASTWCHFTDSESWNMNWAILCYTQPILFYSVRNFYIQWSSVSLWSVPRQTDRNLKKVKINFYSLWISTPKFFSKRHPNG